MTIKLYKLFQKEIQKTVVCLHVSAPDKAAEKGDTVISVVWTDSLCTCLPKKGVSFFPNGHKTVSFSRPFDFCIFPLLSRGCPNTFRITILPIVECHFLFSSNN